MGVLQKAYTFVKKHWSTDDDVFPDDLNRYEDGIDDLYSVTNQTNTNIGNLSNLLSQAKSNIVTAINEIVTNLQSEIETRGNTDTELERQINVLSTDRGYKDTKLVPNDTDFNTITDNGIYWANAWVHPNILTLADGTRLNGVVHVMQADGVVYQFFHSNKGKWYREKYSTGWTNWQQITTNNETIVKMGELTNSHNMNNVVKSGVYRIFGTTPANFVSGQTNGYFSVLVYENNFYTVQEATNFVTGQIYKRLINSNDGEIFKDWYEVATITQTNISLLNGWVNYDGINHPLRAIRTGKVVNVIGRIKDGVFDTGTVIATLPAWGTYKFVKGIVIGLDGDGNKVFEVNVSADGRITCQGKWASAQYGYIFNFSVDLI